MNKPVKEVSMVYVYSKIGEFPIQTRNMDQRMKDRKEFLLKMLDELGIKIIQ